MSSLVSEMSSETKSSLSNKQIVDVFNDRLGQFLSLISGSVVDVNEYFGFGGVQDTLLTWFLSHFNYDSDVRVQEGIKRLISLGADLSKPQLYYGKRRYPVQLGNDKVKRLLLDLGSRLYVSVADISSATDMSAMLYGILKENINMSETIDTGIKDGPEPYATYHTLLDETRGTPLEVLVREIMVIQGVKEYIEVCEIDKLTATDLVILLKRVIAGHVCLMEPINTPCRRGSTLLERLEAQAKISNPSKKPDIELAINMVRKLEQAK